MKDYKTQKIGIIGGLGPFATLEFQKIFLNKFKRQFKPKSDQDYPEIIVDYKSKTPDRTAYILDNTKPDPTPSLQESLSFLEQAGCEIIVIPCNTAYYFLDRLKKSDKTEIVNIIEQAANSCQKKGYKSPLLLATSGTIESGIYEKFFAKNDIKLIIPKKADIDETMEVIYDGVKAGFTGQDVQNKLAAIAKKYSNFADCVILGCTELPLVDQKIELPTIDPMVAAADLIISKMKTHNFPLEPNDIKARYLRTQKIEIPKASAKNAISQKAQTTFHSVSKI